jgi:hypothetical protein
MDRKNQNLRRIKKNLQSTGKKFGEQRSKKAEKTKISHEVIPFPLARFLNKPPVEQTSPPMFGTHHWGSGTAPLCCRL